MLRKLGIFFIAIGLAKIAWYLIWKDRKYTEQYMICNMDLDIGRLVLAAAIIFLPMYFFQKLADWSTANQKSIADLSVAFCNIVCYIRKSYCNYRREEN